MEVCDCNNNPCVKNQKMAEPQYVYMLLPDGAEWEDMTIILDVEKAIELSKKHPKLRVERFIKSDSKYIPSYSYYKEGVLILPPS